MAESQYTVEPPAPQYTVEPPKPEFTVEQLQQPYPQWLETTLETLNKPNEFLEPIVKKGEEYLGHGAELGLRTFTHTPMAEANLATREPSPGEKGIAKGVGEMAGGVVADPRNWPFLASSAARPLLQRLISGGFGIMMGEQGYDQAKYLSANWDKLSPEDRAKGLTELGGGGVMATLATSHALFGDMNSTMKVGDAHLNTEEANHLKSILVDHLGESTKNGDIEGIHDTLSIVADILKEKQHGRAATIQTEEDIHPLQGEHPGGPVYPTSPTAEPPSTPQIPGEEDIRPTSGVTGREEPTGELAGTGPQPQGEGGTAPSDIAALLPEYYRTINGGGEGRAPLAPDQTGVLADRGEPTHVISEAVDNDLANNSVQVVERGKDIGIVQRFLGGLEETSRLLNRQGHPLGPILSKLSGYMSDVTKSIIQDQINTMRDYVTNSKKLVSRDEWTNQVIPLMEGPDVPNGPRPPNVPDNVWRAYQAARQIDTGLRIKIRDAKRAELQVRGIDPATINQWVPDDWGMDSHYHHAFPGTWAITRVAGVDARGNPIYEPIADANDPTISWRTSSMSEAKDMAQRYITGKQGEQIRIQQDSVNLPGKGITDRNRLIQLAKDVKDASTLVINGANPEDVLKQLYDESAAKAYGPKPISSRQFGAAMQRESNLPGWARDRENFEDYLMATERYVNLLPARQALIKARNAIAAQGGFPAIQRLSDMPGPTQYTGGNRQYGNILGRVDAAIEGLEGHPGFSDAYLRKFFSDHGLDPNILSTITRPLQSITALLKLGFNPARVLSHGLQSLWAVYPVLGERASLYGMAHSYDSNYKFLVDDLAITHGVNASDIEGLRSYMGNYFGRGSNPIDWSKGVGSILYDVGMLPFTTGIEFTRRMAAIGAYDKAIRQGMPPAQARNYARDILDRTTGNYSAADNSVLLRQLPGPVAQFKNFMLKTAQFTYGLRGAEIPRFLTAVTALGFTSFPFLRAMNNLIKNTTGEDTELDLKRLFPVASRGVFGPLGLDVPTGVGLGDLSITRENTPLAGVGGPALSDTLAVASAAAQRVIKGPGRKSQDELDTAIRNISPEARRIWDEANRMASSHPSLVDPRTGAVIIKDLTPTERVELLSGLTPLRVAQERDTHEYIRNQVEQSKDRRGYFVDKLAELQVNLSDPKLSASDRADIIKQTLDYTHMAEEYGVAKSLPKAVIERAKQMQQERLQRDLKLAPKSQRLKVYEEQQRYKGEQ